MTRNLTLVFAISLLFSTAAYPQVDEIKRSSRSSRDGGGEGGSGGPFGGSYFMGDFVFQMMFGGVVQAQQQKLQKRHDIPSLVSLDMMLQGAGQPSSYYILNPRIRGNWGLFSTDFRLNYILEEDIDGVKYIRTNDWQVLQLNIVTTRDVTARIGGGVIYESFEEKNNYPEWTAGVDIRPFGSKLGGLVEYRGSEARREINGHIRYAIFERGHLHGYVTAGAVFQRYYQQVNVWGLQGGIVFSLF